MSRLRLALALAAGGLGVLVALWLGAWQTQRAAAKVEAERRWEAAATAPARELDTAHLPHRDHLPLRVQARGQFMHDKSVWLDNRPLNGRAGLLLVTPLALGDGAFSTDAGATVVLVMRGWVPRDAHDRSRVPAVAQPQGVIRVDGLLLTHAPRVFDLGEAGQPAPLPAIWQNLDFERYSQVAGLTVAPFVLQQHGGAEDGLVRDWPRPGSGADKHRGYALQWYSLAGLMAVLTLVLGTRAVLARRKQPVS